VDAGQPLESKPRQRPAYSAASAVDLERLRVLQIAAMSSRRAQNALPTLATLLGAESGSPGPRLPGHLDQRTYDSERTPTKR